MSGNRSYLRYIPHGITLASLFFGVQALEVIGQGQYRVGLLLLFLSLLCDALDGWAARLLGVASAEGKVLDSLSDMVVFGVVPMFTLRVFMQSLGQWGVEPLLFSSVGYILCTNLLLFAAALRLMRFTAGPTREVFYGLPTPSMALFVVSLPVFFQYYYGSGASLVGVWEVLLGVVLWCSAAMLWPMQMISLRFRGYALRQNALRYLFFAGAGLGVFYLHEACFVVIVPWYVLLSLLSSLLSSSFARRTPAA